MFLGIRFEADEEFAQRAVGVFEAVVGPLLTTVASFGRGNQELTCFLTSLIVPHAKIAWISKRL